MAVCCNGAGSRRGLRDLGGGLFCCAERAPAEDGIALRPVGVSVGCSEELLNNDRLGKPKSEGLPGLPLDEGSPYGAADELMGA